MQTKVEKIVPQEGNASLAGGVVVNGETLPADFVVMGVGVAPATEFVKQSGIEVERDGGILVNEFLEVQKLPAGVDGVYAIGKMAVVSCNQQTDSFLLGDVAIHPQKGTPVRIEHWNVS